MDFIAAGNAAMRRNQQTSTGTGSSASLPRSSEGASTRRTSPAPASLSFNRAQALAGLGQGVPSNLLPDITAQMDEFSDDAETMRNYLVLVMLLGKDPKTLESFVKHMKEGMKAARTPMSPPPQQLQQLQQALSGAQGTTWSVEIEISTTQFSSWFGRTAVAQQGGGTQVVEAAGATLTQETTRIRITVQNGRFQVGRADEAPKDPLTLDLNGNGTFDMANRGLFDVDGDGRVDSTPLPSAGDAFLALDVNGNGRIDDGHELFGDQNGAAQGFEELAKYDGNADGAIDANDAVFGRLEVMGDFDDDGEMEQKKLSETGVTGISLQSEAVNRKVSNEVELTQAGTYTRNGQKGLAGVLLVKYV